MFGMKNFYAIELSQFLMRIDMNIKTSKKTLKKDIVAYAVNDRPSDEKVRTKNRLE